MLRFEDVTIRNGAFTVTADLAIEAGRRVAVQFGGMAWEWLINERVDAVLHPVNEESLVLVEVMRGDAETLYFEAELIARANGEEVARRRWEDRVPRQFV